ncbi:hypothetical protein PA25_03640 [Pseudoalteromonas sp. A25]|uniref:hypothetical protein n=1 Tax=Pseudoalteromonas sp. A25 TaxID=116092 RepID=UPI0012604A9B|nr:hypothetical protein [Pseudoalteromonas sp. A25]BBN80379.1 hypothetical protein PA25_03640 [Pseudoalteromonas sp. A25]
MLTVVSNKLSDLALQYIGYYNGSLLCFRKRSNTIVLEPADESFNPTVVILSREYYQESLRTIPLEDVKQVRKLLKLEQESEQLVSTLRFSKSEGKTSYMHWKSKKDFPNATFVLPESLILTENVSFNQTLIVQEDRPLFLVKTVSGIQSCRANNLILDESRFLLSTGIQTSDSAHIISEQNFPSALIFGIKKLPIKTWLAFFKGVDGSIKSNSAKVTLMPIMLVGFSYLIISSLFLFWENHSLEKRLQTRSLGVSEALNVQYRVEQLTKRYEALQLLGKGEGQHNDFFKVLSNLLSDVSLTNIRLNKSNRYVLRGSTYKATDVLSKLLGHPLVHDAQFDYPTRKSREREVFVISFSLKPIVGDEV